MNAAATTIVEPEPEAARTVVMTVVVPTRNERDNIAPLLARLQGCIDTDTEVLFVDDSDDDTPEVVARFAEQPGSSVRLLHRTGEHRTGGLSGAVTAGLAAAQGRHVVVMDGDLQHPPELITDLRRVLLRGDVDLVAASRYRAGGSSAGLAKGWRHAVSSASTIAARAMFPLRVGRRCTDPMTGFFAVDTHALQLGSLEPHGFKILLEILARHDLAVDELPLDFGRRHAGDSKADWRQGVRFLRQLVRLRLTTPALRFALVGAFGFVVNLGLTAVLLGAGTHYLLAAAVGSEATIIGNFLLQERFVFADGLRRWWVRLLHTLTLNNLELLIRIPVLAFLVGVARWPALVALSVTIVAGFVGRFLFLSRVTYRGPVDDQVTEPAGVVAQQAAA